MGKNANDIPKEALTFSSSAITFQYEEEADTPKFNMIGYSGKTIPNHWYWGNLAINLKGMQFDKDRYPILEDHDTSKKIAFTSVPSIEQGQLAVTQDFVTFLDTQEAKTFLANSKKGFPYQASIYAVPTKTTRLGKDESIEVNGFMVDGPGTVWDECVFKEVSICVFGYDSNTQAQAMSKEVEIIMDMNELKAKHPDLVNQIVSESESKFVETKKVLDDKIVELSETIKERDKRIIQFEKDEAIRKESEMSVQADGIWNECLSKSNVPVHLFAKVKKHVVYSDFVKDGKFETEAFAKAVTDEAKDWEEKGVTSNVIGGHFGKTKDVDGDDKLSEKKDNTDRANSLLNLVGMKA